MSTQDIGMSPIITDTGSTERPEGGPPDRLRGSFAGGAVVHLVAAPSGGAGAIVTTVHAATVTLTDDRIVATDDGFRWSWKADEVTAVGFAASETWTILDTPSSPGFGVAVRPDQVQRFRRVLSQLPGIARLPAEALIVHPDRTELGRPAAAAPNTELEALAQRLDATGWTAPQPTIAIDHYAGAAEPPRRRGRRRLGRRAAVVPAEQVAPTAPAPPAVLPPATLEADAVTAWFGNHQVLDRVSLTMPAGQVTALIGPSGCGKSTFLRILNRMHEMIPSAALAGEVRLEGRDIYDPSRKLTDARREIGMVFQKPNPFPAMSIYDNVVASLRLTGTRASTEQKDEIVETCLSKAGLWNEVRDRLRQPGGGLSGGQQQRLCIARALAIKPRVLLMDEPCSALDPTSTRRIEQTIRELVDEVTIVIVTHNMQQAARVSDQCAFFLAEQGTPGVIVEHGPTEAMFGSPQDQRTSDYVNGRFG